MSVIKVIYRGDSLTIAVVFPETYDMARLQELEITIGSRVYTHTIDGQIATVRLASEDTARLTAIQEIMIAVDDSTFGVKKISGGSVSVQAATNNYQSDSETDNNDIVIPLSLTATTLTVDDVLYDYFGSPILGDNCLYLSSPNGTHYKVTVTNDGELLVETI